MDMAVGYCILGSAVTYRYESKFSISHIFYVLRGSLPGFCIGFSRYLLYKCIFNYIIAVNYPGEVKAYGIHWNFFYTICVVRIIGEILISSAKKPLLVLIEGILMICIYQWFLCKPDVLHYIFEAPRINFISSNREGIFQCFGYIALHLIGTYFGYFAQKYFVKDNINKPYLFNNIYSKINFI